MTRPATWLRANAAALVVLAALATASIWYSFTIDWQQYRDGNPTRLVDVPRGEESEYGGGVFAIDGLTVVAGDSADGRRYGVQEGTDLVVLDLAVTPDPDGDPDDYLGCDIRFTAPSPDGERIWWPTSSNPTSYPEPDDAVFGCNVAGGPAYVYRQYFVVPAGGAEDGAVQITMWDELPRALRLH